MNKFLEAVFSRTLILDGGMGTMLQSRGLKCGGCPEEMTLHHPDVVSRIHDEYVSAGSDAILTNTFGGNRIRLAHYHLEDKVRELNSQAVELARKSASQSVFVGGSVGPTGGTVESGFDSLVEIFTEQITSLADSGVDFVCFETFQGVEELKAGVMACKDVCNLPIVAQMTFVDHGNSANGLSPAGAAAVLESLPIDVLGSNCGQGIAGIYDTLTEMRAATKRPFVAQANAGLPVIKGGSVVYSEKPEDHAAYLERFVALDVRIVGGCCGTTPAHISSLRAAVDGSGS